jgi:hypothetical protein
MFLLIVHTRPIHSAAPINTNCISNNLILERSAMVLQEINYVCPNTAVLELERLPIVVMNVKDIGNPITQSQKKYLRSLSLRRLRAEQQNYLRSGIIHCDTTPVSFHRHWEREDRT